MPLSCRYLQLLIIATAVTMVSVYPMPSPQQVEIYEALLFDNFEQAEELIMQNAGINLNFLAGENNTSPLGLIVRRSVNDTTPRQQERFLSMIYFLRIHGASPVEPGITFCTHQTSRLESPLQFMHKCLEECVILNTNGTTRILEIYHQLSSNLQIN